jgi:hypothetical protein
MTINQLKQSVSKFYRQKKELTIGTFNTLQSWVRTTISTTLEFCVTKAKNFFLWTKNCVIKFYWSVVYRIRLVHWYLRNILRVCWVYLTSRVDLARRVGFILVAIGVGWFINRYGLDYFTQELLSNYLVSVGAMIGGAIAIIFTISLGVFTTSASLYPALFAEVDNSSYREKLTYFLVGVITILHLGAGLYISGIQPFASEEGAYISPVPLETSSLVINISLFLVAIVFVLIDWQYKTIKEKSDPYFAIAGFERNTLRRLRKMQRDADIIAGILKAKDTKLSHEMALATAYNQVLQPFVSELERKIESLIETALKFSDRQELHTTKRAFTAVHAVLIQFLDARKTSSLIIPSGISLLAVQSDSQNFLSRVFERLNKAGEKFIKEDKDASATYIIDIYNSLANKAQEISFVESRRNENPVFGLIVSYLEFLIDLGKKAKNIEVVYQGAGALENMAVISAYQGLQTTLHGINEKVLEIFQYGLTEKQTIIIDRSVGTYLKIIGALFGSNKIIRRYSFDDALKAIGSIAFQTLFMMKAGHLRGDFITRMSVGKGYDDMYTLLIGILNHYGRLTDDREKESYRNDLSEFFDELGMSIRKLSENIKDADSVLVDSVGRLLAHVNEIMIELINNAEFADEKAELQKNLSWNIHLPSWFAHHAEKFDAGSNPFNTLTESVAKTGILVFENLKDKKLVEACIDCLYSMTKHALDKTDNTYGYDEPRILEKACYLGILALKNGWEDVLAQLRVHILDFEPKYIAKHFSNLPPHIDPEKISPKKYQLFVELYKWRDEFNYNKLNSDLRIRDDAEAMMYSLIVKSDIDKFLLKVFPELSTKYGIHEDTPDDI